MSRQERLAETRLQAEGRRQKAEGRRQKAEGGRRKAEGGSSHLRTCSAPSRLTRCATVRILLELVVIAALIAFAWEKSYRQHAGELPVVGRLLVTPTPTPTPTPSARAVRTSLKPAPAPTPTGSWMWDAKHHGTLDRPSPGAHTNQPTSAFPATPTPARP